MAKAGTNPSIQKVTNTGIPHWRLLLDQGAITQQIQQWPYEGLGTTDSPYIVRPIDNDPRNAMLVVRWKKWVWVVLEAVSTLMVSLASTTYAGTSTKIREDFHVSQIVCNLGIALFVLGFAVGPILWAPLGELYGRQVILFVSYGLMVLFLATSVASQNITTLVVLRFFAGACGASTFTNTAGVIADLFPSSERGMAMNLFGVAPFMGPAFGPVIGGFLGDAAGWRWVAALTALASGSLWITTSVMIPETYWPVLLRKRAGRLSKLTGRVYLSQADLKRGPPSLKNDLKIALTRPWKLLVHEPIVLFMATYMSIIYGTLYMMFGAFPVVFIQYRGWSAGLSGLAFIGILVGMAIGVSINIWDNRRYMTYINEATSNPAPETRLPPAILGSILLPIGLFWFAWTNAPSIHWSVCIIGSSLFGIALVLNFVASKNYLVDSYTIYAASAITSTVVIRSVFGAAFPLFTQYMYGNLGIHWASSIPAFLALGCLPFPYFFYKKGHIIRSKCKYSREAEVYLKSLQNKNLVRDPIAEPGKEQHVEGNQQENKSEEEKTSGKDNSSSERISA